MSSDEWAGRGSNASTATAEGKDASEAASGADEGGRVAGGPAGPPDRRRRVRRALLAVLSLGLVLALVIAGGLWFLASRYGGNIDRVSDVFAQLDEGARPAPATPAESSGDAPVTFLLVGSDTRGEVARGKDPDGRSDAIMIARFSANRTHAQLISIPRDSWVEIPGHGRNKINASYAFGGPSLLIQTVEQLTQIRIDHYVTIDFEGIIQVTDDLGGVEVMVAETTENGPYTFPAGPNQLNGDQVRWYLAQRYGLPGGDFDRVKRQQQYLRAMFAKLASSETFTDPRKLDAAVLAITNAVSIDDTLGNRELLSLAYSMRNVRSDGVQFFTAPVLGTGMEGSASVVYLDAVTGERMWTYLRSDSLWANGAEFAKQALPDVPR